MSEIETLQQKTVTTSFTLQLSKRDKLNEFQQSLYLKGNWYLYVISASPYMVLLLALDLAVIPKTQDLSTVRGNEKTFSSQLRERDKQMEDLQQSLKGSRYY